MKQSLIEQVKSIFEWSKMPIEQRYNVVLAIGIVGLVSIIVIQQDRIKDKRIEYQEERIRLQSEINQNKDSYMEYLRQIDSEYRELLKYLNSKK